MVMIRNKELIGSQSGLRNVCRQVEIVAPSDCAVLIQGETGTGKELIARAIHDNSRRRAAPFVTLNCAAIPAGLFESELFGHDRGAFTGACNQTVGKFQLAHTGTLFLDEIGDLPLELQSKLLRVLQEREFERVGSNRTIRVDVRIVAATNQDLDQMVSERRFRADLFYRLNVFPIRLPPLRDRLPDLPLLVNHFVYKFAALEGKQSIAVPQALIEVLQRHRWPGNIRELENFIERAVLLTTGPSLYAPAAELKAWMPSLAQAPLRTLAELEQASITEALWRSNGVVGGNAGAAAQLGIPRTTLIARMRKHGISRKTLDFRPIRHRENSSSESNNGEAVKIPA